MRRMRKVTLAIAIVLVVPILVVGFFILAFPEGITLVPGFRPVPGERAKVQILFEVSSGSDQGDVVKLLRDFSKQNGFSIRIVPFEHPSKSYVAVYLESSDRGEFQIDNSFRSDQYGCLYFAHGVSTTHAIELIGKFKAAFLALPAKVVDEQYFPDSAATSHQ